METLLAETFWIEYAGNERQGVKKFLLKIVKILISFLLHPICSIARRVKTFLPQPDSSKTFWQLGCQVAALFPPLQVTFTVYSIDIHYMF